MSYVQTPSTSELVQPWEPAASGVVSGAMRAALIRVEPSSIPRMASPARIISAAPSGRWSTSARSIHLAVIGARPVLAPEVTLEEGVVDRTGVWIEQKRPLGDRRDRLEGDGVRDCVGRVHAPGERPMGADQDRRHLEGSEPDRLDGLD